MSAPRKDIDNIPVGADWPLTVTMPVGVDTTGWAVVLYFLAEPDDNLADAIESVAAPDVTVGQGSGGREIRITIKSAKTRSMGRSKPWYSVNRTDTNAKDRLAFGIMDMTIPRAADAS